MKNCSACYGCRNDFYNGKQNAFGFGCSSLKSARMVIRWKLAWWTAPTEPRAFEEVKVPNCYHTPGKYAYYEKLPSFAVDPIKRTRKIPHGLLNEEGR